MDYSFRPGSSKKNNNRNKAVTITAIAIIAVLVIAIVIVLIILKKNDDETVIPADDITEAPTIVPYNPSNEGGNAPTSAPEPTPDPGKTILGQEVINKLKSMEDGKAYLATDLTYINRILNGEEYKYARYFITEDGVIIKTGGNPIAIHNYGSVSKGSCITVTKDGQFILEGGFETEDYVVEAYREMADGSLSAKPEQYVVKKSKNEWDGNNNTLNIQPNDTYREITLSTYDGQPVGYVFIPEQAYDSIKANLAGSVDPYLPDEDAYPVDDSMIDVYPDESDDYEEYYPYGTPPVGEDM